MTEMAIEILWNLNTSRIMIRWEAKIKLCFLFHFSFSVGSEPQHVFNRVARSVERILHLPCNIFFLHSSFASAFDGLSTPQAQTQERRFIFDHYISWFNTRDTYFPLFPPRMRPSRLSATRITFRFVSRCLRLFLGFLFRVVDDVRRLCSNPSFLLFCSCILCVRCVALVLTMALTG